MRCCDINVYLAFVPDYCHISPKTLGVRVGVVNVLYANVINGGLSCLEMGLASRKTYIAATFRPTFHF